MVALTRLYSDVSAVVAPVFRWQHHTQTFHAAEQGGFMDAEFTRGGGAVAAIVLQGGLNGARVQQVMRTPPWRLGIRFLKTPFHGQLFGEMIDVDRV